MKKVKENIQVSRVRKSLIFLENQGVFGVECKMLNSHFYLGIKQNTISVEILSSKFYFHFLSSILVNSGKQMYDLCSVKRM